MTGSTISGTITNQTVTLGSASYASPLTITATGAIVEDGNGQAIADSSFAIVGAGTSSGLSVLNQGTIQTIYDAVEIQNGSLVNVNLIVGNVAFGSGVISNSGIMDSSIIGGGSAGDTLIVSNSGTIAAGYDFEVGGNPGVALASAGSIQNRGTIIGGSGGFGDGGSGVRLSAGGTLTNTGLVEAGSGRAGGFPAVLLQSGGTVVNSGTILGAGSGYGAGNGVSLAAGGVIYNTGSIIGGQGQFGGIAIVQSGGFAENEGVVIAGGPSYQDGSRIQGFGLVLTGYGTFDNLSILTAGLPAASGAEVAGGSTLLNAGLVSGGTGGESGYPEPAPLGLGTFKPTDTATTGGLGVSIGSIGLVINTGTITGGAGGNGYYAAAGGTGVYVGTAGLLVNDELVESGKAGGGTASLDAGVGVGITIAGGTVVNAGTIMGDPGQARGVRQPGYGAAVDFSGAGTLVEDQGAVLLGSLAGFASGDVVILPSFTETGFSYVSGIGLELDTAGTVLTLDLAGSFTTSDFLVTQDTGATTIALHGTTTIVPNPCFTPGTRILTARGEVAVEALAVGDAVINHAGEDQEIVWIGRRDLDICRHPKPETVRPVIIEAGALAEGVPARRLVISPDHALFIDNVLVQAKDLVNGSSIRPDLNARHVRYYHVELAVHDILFAEGAAVESYLDTGHRGAFDNAEAPLLLHPDLMQVRREAEGCAPLCLGGPKLAAIRQDLARRDHGQSVEAVLRLAL